MKKIVFILSLIALFIVSCDKQDSLDPRPVIVGGQYVRIDFTNKILAGEHLNDTYFGGILTTPANNVAKYVLKVRRSTPNNVITDNYKAIKFGTEDTIRSFPLDLRITPQMIADALQIPVSTLQIGDKYFFYGEAYGFDGTKTTYNNLSATVRIQPGMKQAFRFVTSLENDSNINNFGATYDNYNF